MNILSQLKVQGMSKMDRHNNHKIREDIAEFNNQHQLRHQQNTSTNNTNVHILLKITNLEHVLGHKTHLKIFEEYKSFNVFSDHNVIKLEINEYKLKNPKLCGDLNNTSKNKSQENFKIFEMSEMKELIKICGIQWKQCLEGNLQL